MDIVISRETEARLEKAAQAAGITLEEEVARLLKEGTARRSGELNFYPEGL